MLQFFITLCLIFSAQKTYNCCSFKPTANSNAQEITNIITAIGTSQGLFAVTFKNNLIGQPHKEFSTWFKYIKLMQNFIEKSHVSDYKNTKTMWHVILALAKQLKTTIQNINTIYTSDASDFDKMSFINTILQNTPQFLEIIETLKKGLFDLARKHKPNACFLSNTSSLSNNDGYDLVYHLLLSLQKGYQQTLDDWIITTKNLKQNTNYQLLQEILHAKQEK